MRVAFLKSFFLACLLFSLPMLLGGCPAKRGAPDAGPPDGKIKAVPVEPLVVVEWSGKFADGWKEYDRLIGEQVGWLPLTGRCRGGNGGHVQRAGQDPGLTDRCRGLFGGALGERELASGDRQW